MASVDFDSDGFKKEPVLGILRGVEESSLQGVLSAAVEGGLRFLEITFNTPNAPRLIEQAIKVTPDSGLCIGCGTVLNVDDAQTAFDSGARFIVAPTLNPDVASFCRGKNIPYFPGAFTPTEIEKAWNAGAALVKVFPASQVQPKYFKEIKGPFPHVKLMAVGGLNAGNVEEYLKAGADALAFGASIFSVDRMKNREYATIQKDIREFVLAVQGFYTRI